MSVIFYSIAVTADYGELGKKNPVVIEKYKFDWEDKTDRETMEEYVEKLSRKNFKYACYRFLVETEIDWEQRGVPYILLDEKEFSFLQKNINNSLEVSK